MEGKFVCTRVLYKEGQAVAGVTLCREGEESCPDTANLVLTSPDLVGKFREGATYTLNIKEG